MQKWVIIFKPEENLSYGAIIFLWIINLFFKCTYQHKCLPIWLNLMSVHVFYQGRAWITGKKRQPIWNKYWAVFWCIKSTIYNYEHLLFKLNNIELHSLNCESRFFSFCLLMHIKNRNPLWLRKYNENSSYERPVTWTGGGQDVLFYYVLWYFYAIFSIYKYNLLSKTLFLLECWTASFNWSMAFQLILMGRIYLSYEFNHGMN